MYGQTTNGTFARKMRHICNETKKNNIVERNIRTCCKNRLLWCITLLQLYCNAFTFLLIGFTRNDTRNVLFTRHCIYCAIDIKYFDLHLR